MNSPTDPDQTTRIDTFTVADWRIDPLSNSITRGEVVHRIEPKAMQVLAYLASRAGQVVTRRELEKRVWAGVVVGPDALTNAIIKLRRSFGDDARSANYIETIPKTGYRLIAPVDADGGNDEPTLQRKLAAILYADVADYSRLTGENEDITHRTLSKYLDLFSNAISAHNGMVVHYAGDAILAEFATVTEATSCAVEVQRELRVEDTPQPENAELQFRIGINVGEVIVDRDDIYGDGVNVAARLESLAEPGGICISDAVRVAIGNKLPLDYEYLGEQSVKNIAEPVRAYRVLFYPSAQQTKRRPGSIRWVLTVATASVAVVFLAAFLVWQQLVLSPEAVVEESDIAAPAPDKPAIAVLPFANVNVNPEEEYFADGMTDDLITDLSKVSGVDVIARNSVFTFKNRAINVSEVGRELGAQYIVEGSIRRAQDRVRVNVQLVDAGTGRHIWAERFDRGYQDFFLLQDEVVEQVVSAVSVKLTDTEQERIERRPTASLEAYDYYLRAEQAGYVGGNEGLSDTMSLYTKAIALDPQFAEAYAGLARTAVEVWRQDVVGVMASPEARARAYDSAAQALDIDPSNGRAYSVLAVLQLTEGHHQAAIESARKAVTLRPGDALAHFDLGLVLAYSGKPKAAVAAVNSALRLNPKPSPDALIYAGIVFFIDGEYQRSIEALSKARTDRQDNEGFLSYLPAALAQSGQTEEARSLVQKHLQSYPTASIEYYRARETYYRRADDLERLLVGLKMAGFPEWPYDFRGAESARLEASELRAITLGKTWSGTHASGVPFLQEISATGALAYSSRTSLLTGTATIRDKKLCQQFEGAILGKEVCGYVYRNEAGSADTQDEFIAVMPHSLRYFSIVQ